MLAGGKDSRFADVADFYIAMRTNGDIESRVFSR